MGGTEQSILYADTALGSADILKKELRLSIELSLNGFSFSIKNITDNTFLAAGSTVIRYGSTYQRLLSTIIDTFETKVEIASLKYAKVDIQYLDTMFTIVPEELYEPTHAVDYLSFTMGRDMGSTAIQTQTVDPISSVCVFTSNDKISEYFKTKSAEVHSHHSITTFLSHVQKMPNQEHQIHVNTIGGYMQVVVFNGEKLLTANIYELKDQNTFSYYLLSLCNQLRLDERKVPIVFYGNPEEYVKQHDTLSRYFLNKKYAQRTQTSLFSPSLDWVAQFEYFNTLND